MKASDVQIIAEVIRTLSSYSKVEPLVESFEEREKAIVLKLRVVISK